MHENQRKLNEVLSRLQPQLKHLGFKKRNNTYNRRTEEDLVQVINLQLGRHGSAANSGTFTINLGTAIPGLEQLASPSRDHSQFVREVDCDFRQRIGLIPDVPGTLWKDLWWPLDGDTVVAEVEHLLFGRAMRWFEDLSSIDCILDKLESEAGDSRSISGRPDRLLAAQIRLVQGRKDLAQTNFDAHVKTLDRKDLIEGMRWFANEYGLEFNR